MTNSDNIIYPKKVKPSSPFIKLQNIIESYFKNTNLQLTDDLKSEIPNKWEKYNDLVLFDDRFFKNTIWGTLKPSFWEDIAKSLQCSVVGVKSKIVSDKFRSPKVKILFGNSEWVLYKDNGIHYTWNICYSMFCAGNVSERHRISRMKCDNEVIIDMFAGIGYFTLPYLKYTNPKFVYACEWNPYAIEALKRNLKLNKLEKCDILEGDNNLTCPVDIADRINLGLIPSSERSWKTACLALKRDKGGILHLHTNVETKNKSCCEVCYDIANRLNFFVNPENLGFCLVNDGYNFTYNDFVINWKFENWFSTALHVCHKLCDIMLDIQPSTRWLVSVQNLHNVKSYAPHVYHLVLDISLTPILE